ncbi:hypothetical protein [Flavobacterium sp.]|uniref:hypothetical protein n=1 Tax=Flavobacterium sp. TaxID=239 RepID=UPI00286AFB18|nr:hypothetical protein [Flavobacterium sp.]
MKAEIFNPEVELNNYKSENREDYNFEIRQKRPSKSYLTNFAQKILDIAKK